MLETVLSHLKRSFGLTRSLFILYVHEKGRLGLGMLGVTMATIKLWPQWLAFLNIPNGDLLPCKFEWGGQNFSFPTLFDSYRELLFNGSPISWVSIVFHIGLGLCTAQLSLPKGTGSKFVFRLCSRSFPPFCYGTSDERFMIGITCDQASLVFFRGGKERLIQLLDYSSAAP